MNILTTIISNWQGILQGFLWLSVTVTIIAFVHEFGHYIVAKMCGVKVETFAIGMGKAIFTWKVKRTGEEWKICMFPIGGYVKMLGQSDVPRDKNFEYASQAEQKQSFEFKNPYQKIAISFAGPFANMILTFAILTVILCVMGKNYTQPIISGIEKNSPAYKAKLLVGDEILSVNGVRIFDFALLRNFTALEPCGQVNLEILRKNKKQEQVMNIAVNTEKNPSSEGRFSRCAIGIASDKMVHQDFAILPGIAQGFQDTMQVTRDSCVGIFQLITGQRSLKELSGPLRIGKFSHQAAKSSCAAFFYLVAMISIGVGVMNLLPIPVLDGGHIFMNLIAIIIRKDVPAKVQNVIYKIGFAMVISLMVIGFLNDFKFLIRL